MYEDEEEEDFGTEGERLARLLAKRGLASRRGAEAWQKTARQGEEHDGGEKTCSHDAADEHGRR